MDGDQLFQFACCITAIIQMSTDISYGFYFGFVTETTGIQTG